MSDERPDDDLKAWAEWKRKPGDERPDVQQAMREVGIVEDRSGTLRWVFKPHEVEVSSSGGTATDRLIGVLTETRYVIDGLQRRADVAEAENRRLREALEKALDIAEEWIYGELSGTSLLDREMAKLEPCRQALAAADTGRPER